MVTFEIDDPQLVERVAQHVPQAGEAWTTQIRRRADEADDPRAARCPKTVRIAQCQK